MRIAVPLSPRERARSEESLYIVALRMAGAKPGELIALGPDEELPEEFDGLLLTGGADVDPARYGETNRASRTDGARDVMDFALIEQALREQRPLFAICRGLQALNVALGGTLYQDLVSDGVTTRSHRSAERPLRIHEVVSTCEPSLLSGLLPLPCPVNSLHHQAARMISPRLRQVARAVDDDVVEGLEAAFPYPWLLAVQWHPEELQDDPKQMRLFEAFVEACRRHSTANS